MAKRQVDVMNAIRNFLRIVCANLSIFITSLLITGILNYSRDVHNIRTSSDPLTPDQRKLLNALNIEIPANESVWNMTDTFDDEIIVKYGILRNCYFQSEIYQKCEIPVNVGFVGDTAVVALLGVAVAFSIISFILSIVSVYYSNTFINGWHQFYLNTRVDIALHLTHMISVVCSGIGVMISIHYHDKAYISHEEYNTVAFPLQITFGIGFDVTIAAFIFNVITFLISTSASCMSFSIFLASK